MATRGFVGRRRSEPSGRVPPGQYLTDGFPVLSAGPTPRTSLDHWSFTLTHGDKALASWTWEQFLALPHTQITVDIHCVTKWSKLDTVWEGISFDALLEAAGLEPPTAYVMAFCDGGYTTNVPVADLRKGKAMVAFRYGGADLAPEHGGPARLLVPHLYFWKSAKWVRGLRFMESDEPGFWETHGYHIYGDPWREQRYWGD
jgi:DMSO/TMAO reductase YedYZ molybdopterin-dependent catalytic subunit